MGNRKRKKVNKVMEKNDVRSSITNTESSSKNNKKKVEKGKNRNDRKFSSDNVEVPSSALNNGILVTMLWSFVVPVLLLSICCAILQQHQQQQLEQNKDRDNGGSSYHPQPNSLPISSSLSSSMKELHDRTISNSIENTLMSYHYSDEKKDNGDTTDSSADRGREEEVNQNFQIPKKKNDDIFWDLYASDNDDDDTGDQVIITQQQQRAVEHIQHLEKKLRSDPNNIYTLVQLGDMQMMRDATALTGALGGSLSAPVAMYRKALTLLDVSGVQTPAAFQRIAAFRCEITQRLSMAYLLARDPTLQIRTLGHLINELQCQSDVKNDALHQRAKAFINEGEFKKAYNDLETLFKFHLHQPGFATLPIDLMVNLLGADEGVVEGGWEDFVALLNSHITEIENIIKGMVNSSEETNQESILEVNMQLQQAHRALFVYHDKKTKDFDRAWDHLVLANEYKQKYSPAPGRIERNAVEGQINERIEFFNPSFFENVKGSGVENSTPIFVIGYPRSGTTLMESILSAHSNISGLGEQSALMNLMPRFNSEFPIIYKNGGINEFRKYSIQCAKQVFKLMRNSWQASLQNEVNHDEHISHLIDKQNVNFQFVPYIHVMFPNSLIIHMVRDPIDVVFSNFRLDLSTSSNGQNFDATSDLEANVEAYKRYRYVMGTWERILPGRITHVRYDELVNDTESVLKAIIEKLSLDWEPTLLNYEKKSRSIFTPSNVQVRKGILKHSILRWKNYEKQLEPTISLLGTLSVWDQQTTL